MKRNTMVNGVVGTSSSKFALRTFVVACSLAGSMSAQAATLFSQVSTYTSLVPSYQQAFENGLWAPKYYDDFSLASTNTINEIGWVGGFADGNNYGPNIPPPSPPSTGFTVSIFNSTVNGPNGVPTGAALYSTTVAATGGQVFNQNVLDSATQSQWFHFYDYHATLPSGFLANAGTEYWVSIQANNTGIEWDWATAGTGRSIVDRLSPDPRWATNFNLAFALYNNTQNVPEPDSFALVGIGMLAWWGASRARKSGN